MSLRLRSWHRPQAPVGQGILPTLEVPGVLVLVVLLNGLAADAFEPLLHKARTTEAMGFLSLERVDVVAHHAVTGHWPTRAMDGATEGAGRVDAGAITVDPGAISPTGHRLQGSALTFRPMVPKGRQAPAAVRWLCGYAPAAPGHEAKGPNRTDIPRENLIGLCSGRVRP